MKIAFLSYQSVTKEYLNIEINLMLDNNILYWDLRQTGASANTVLPASMLNAFPQNFVLVIPADATFVVHADVPSTSRRLRLQEYRCLDYYNS